MKRVVVFIVAVCSCVLAFAQSQDFRLGKWTEIQNAVMRNLAKYYVDTLPVDRMYESGLDVMLDGLDPYTVFVPESEQENFEMMISNTYGGIGAVIYKPDINGNVIINEPYLDTPASKNGLQCADEILQIGEESVVGMTVSQASSKMKGEAGTKVVFKIKKARTGEIIEKTITRERIHRSDVEYFGMLDDQTGYIYQSGFTAGVSEEVKNCVYQLKKSGMKRLVLDLRGNGGGLLDEAVAEVALFVPKNTLVVSSKGTSGDKEYRTTTDPIDLNLPIMVLVDSGSASASEIVSGAIQDLDRGVVAGKRTFGKGLVQRVFPLPYNTSMKVTVAKYYTPSGRCVQAKDYSHRAEDGSVGDIPDSLTREFKTAKGRTVRDGGGITPDIEVASAVYNRYVYAVVAGGLTSNYTIEYCRKHDSIAPVDSFKLTDEDYEDFVEWAVNQKFDDRNEAEVYFDLMVKQLKKDNLYDDNALMLSNVEQMVKMDKRSAFNLYRHMIQPLLEEEIASRYYFQPASIQVRIRTDKQLKEAVSLWK